METFNNEFCFINFLLNKWGYEKTPVLRQFAMFQVSGINIRNGKMSDENFS